MERRMEDTGSVPIARAAGARAIPRGGFTLVEVLVSVLVLSSILGATYLCLEAGLRSREAISSSAELLQKARVALDLLRRDLRAACPLDDEFEFVGMDRELDGIEADNLDFATHNWDPGAPGEGDLSEVSWYVDRVPETRELGLWRRRDPTVDDVPLDGGFREEIVRGIAGFRLEYYDGFTWYDTWGKQVERVREETERSLLQGNLWGLPEAVRITLTLRRSSGEREQDPGSSTADDTATFRATASLVLAGRALSTTPAGGSAGAGEEEGRP